MQDEKPDFRPTLKADEMASTMGYIFDHTVIFLARTTSFSQKNPILKLPLFFTTYKARKKHGFFKAESFDFIELCLQLIRLFKRGH